MRARYGAGHAHRKARRWAGGKSIDDSAKNHTLDTRTEQNSFYGEGELNRGLRGPAAGGCQMAKMSVYLIYGL